MYPGAQHGFCRYASIRFELRVGYSPCRDRVAPQREFPKVPALRLDRHVSRMNDGPGCRHGGAGEINRQHMDQIHLLHIIIAACRVTPVSACKGRSCSQQDHEMPGAKDSEYPKGSVHFWISQGIKPAQLTRTTSASIEIRSRDVRCLTRPSNVRLWEHFLPRPP